MRNTTYINPVKVTTVFEYADGTVYTVTIVPNNSSNSLPIMSYVKDRVTEDIQLVPPTIVRVHPSYEEIGWHVSDISDVHILLTVDNPSNPSES